MTLLAQPETVAVASSSPARRQIMLTTSWLDDDVAEPATFGSVLAMPKS